MALKISQRVKRLSSDVLVQNLGWLTLSQLFNRVTRLLTIVVLARKLTETDYGIIAIIFSITDFANVFIQKGGVGPKLIQADESEVEELSRTAYWINWILCIGILGLHWLLAYPISAFYDNSKLILPIMVVGCVYLLNPFFAIQASLLQRENKLKIEAIAGSVAAFTTQTLMVVFALLNMGIWSVVLAKVLSTFSWFFIYRHNHAWRPRGKFTLYRWKDIFQFSRFPLGIEFLNYVRSNLDYLLIGRFFSLEALGLYFFAFNAGLGVSLSAISMISSSVFPYLCAGRDTLTQLRQRYGKSLKIVTGIMVPLVLLQSSLAPIYVPVIFGEKWIPAIPILILICLSGVPRAFGLVAEQLLLACDRGFAGLKWNIAFTTLFIVSIVIAAQFSLTTVAATVLVVHVILLPIFCILVWKRVFSAVA